MKRKIAIALVVVLALVAALGLRPDLPAAEVDAHYATPASNNATLADGTRLHYLEAGPATAPVLVLVHGSFDSAFTWERVLDELARDFRVIAPDLPAHGLTGQTGPNRYAMQDMVDAVHGLVEHLELSGFDIAGNSMGGNTAWLYALEHPERVRRMVLLDAAGYPTDRASLVDTRPGPVKRFFYRYGNPKLLVRRGLERAVVDPHCITDAFVQRSVDFVRRAGTREAQFLRNQVRDIQKQPFDRIREIGVPTLIIWGSDDALLPVAAAYRFEENLQQGELMVYDGVGHMPQLEAPARVVADVREFLQRP